MDTPTMPRKKGEMPFREKVEKAMNLIREHTAKHGKIIVGCSFGKDSMVLLDLVRRATNNNVPVFTILSNTEFKETYDFKDRMIKEWELDCKEYVFNQVDGFMEDRSLCCGAPKVEATRKAIEGYDAWFSGIRNTEGVTRAHFEHVEQQAGVTKINPILEFTEMDIWRYMTLYNVPLNPIYVNGYRSLGCKHCSEPEITGDEMERAGRWRNTVKEGGECGIHTMK